LTNEGQFQKIVEPGSAMI